VSGKVEATAGPEHLELRGADGTVHSTATLDAGGEFRLKARAGTLKATVVVRGPTGATQELTALPGQRPLAVSVGP
jgi:hypothetical protein